MGVESRQNEGDELSGVRRPPDASEDSALNLHQCGVTGRCVEDLAREIGKYGIPGGARRVAGDPGSGKPLQLLAVRGHLQRRARLPTWCGSSSGTSDVGLGGEPS